jgi:hypothetical protein
VTRPNPVIPTGAFDSQSESMAEWRDLVLSGVGRRVGIALCCLLLAGSARPECVTVEAPKPVESSGHVRIGVVLGGIPAKGVKVNLYLYGTQQSVSEAQSDETGMVVTPKLAKRDYLIVAALDKEVSTSLWVRVLRNHETTTLSMDLTGANYQAHPELGLETYKGTEEQIQNRIPATAGTVADITGTVITDAKIRVLKMGAQYKDFMLPLKPDANGHFAAQLPEGRYVAYFFATSFRTVKIPFEITKDSTGILKIAMEPGPC